MKENRNLVDQVAEFSCRLGNWQAFFAFKSSEGGKTGLYGSLQRAVLDMT
jgi:hypothetical protein